jgi:hypothetical protein
MQWSFATLRAKICRCQSAAEIKILTAKFAKNSAKDAKETRSEVETTWVSVLVCYVSQRWGQHCDIRMLFVSPINLKAFAMLLWRPFGAVLVDDFSWKQCPALDRVAAFQIRILFQRLFCAGCDGTCGRPTGIKRTMQILRRQKMLGTQDPFLDRLATGVFYANRVFAR